MFFSEALDDTPVPAGFSLLPGGMVSALPANQLQDNEASYLYNIDLSDRGEAITRRAFEDFGSGYVGGVSSPNDIIGAAFFDTATVQHLIMVKSTTIYKLTGTTWSVFASWVAGLFVRFVCFAQLNNVLYWVDGSNNLWSHNGTTATDRGNRTTGNAITAPPYSPGVIVSHTSRLVASVISEFPDSVEFSDILDGALWNRDTQSIRVGGGEGDPVTGLVPWIDWNLIVLKRNSIWMVNCDPSKSVAEFPIKPIHRRTGTQAPRTFVQCESDVIGLTDSGVRSIQRTLATSDQQELGPALSAPIDDIIRRINPSFRHLCHATYWNNRYMLSIPLDTSETPDTLLVYNTHLQTWSGIWSVAATVFTHRIDSTGSLRLVIGTSAFYGGPRALQWRDYTTPENEISADYLDFATDVYISEVISKGFDFGDEMSPKKPFTVETDYTYKDYDEPAFDGVALWMIRDYEFIQGITLWPGPKTDSLPKSVVIQHLGQFRTARFHLQTAGGGKLTLRAIRASAFMDSLVLQS